MVLNRKNKETGFSTYLKNLPRIRYLFPTNRVMSMFIPKVPFMDIHRVYVLIIGWTVLIWTLHEFIIKWSYVYPDLIEPKHCMNWTLGELTLRWLNLNSTWIHHWVFLPGLFEHKQYMYMDVLSSIFKDPNVAKHPSFLHDKYVFVSADKAPNNIALCVNHIT